MSVYEYSNVGSGQDQRKRKHERERIVCFEWRGRKQENKRLVCFEWRGREQEKKKILCFEMISFQLFVWQVHFELVLFQVRIAVNDFNSSDIAY